MIRKRTNYHPKKKGTHIMNKLICYKILVGILGICLVAVGSSGNAFAQDGNVENRENVCVMQDSVLASPGIPVVHEGRTYYGCCPMCNQSIKAEPEKYTISRDPVTGKNVDKAFALMYSHKGRVYYFESESSRLEFAKGLSAGLARDGSTTR